MAERHGERLGRRAESPAPTLRANGGGNATPGFQWREGEPRGEVFVGHQYPDSKDASKPSERQRREVEKPAPTITGGSSAALWEGMREPLGMTDRPYPTVASGTEKGGGLGDRAGTKAERVTIAEAAALQSYPPGFVWDAEVVDPRTGKLKPITKTKTFLQIGNAVPPLLAEAVIAAAIERPSHAE